MNRSIFQIWKLKTRTIKLNTLISNGIFFKYWETCKYKWISSPQVNQELKTLNFPFKNKIKNHYCAKFNIINNIKFNNYKYTYLTYNTSENEFKTSEYLGKVQTDKGVLDQVLNYNYQIFTTEVSDKILVKTNKPQELERAYNIEQVLIKSDKINLIEEKLNKGLEFFDKCYKSTQKIDNCYQKLMIDYGEHAELIFKLVFYNYT